VTMMEVIKKETSHLIWCFGKPVATTMAFHASARNIYYFREPDQPGRGSGIKLRIAVDARALDFDRTYCGNASTHRGR
jgi:hypothetical protein